MVSTRTYILNLYELHELIARKQEDPIEFIENIYKFLTPDQTVKFVNELRQLDE